MAKCNNPTHQKYPCPNGEAGHKPSPLVTDARPLPGRGPIDATYCAICDGCAVCGFVMQLPTFETPPVGGVGLSLEDAQELAWRPRGEAGGGPVWQLGIHGTKEGRIRFTVNGVEATPAEYAQAVALVPELNPPALVAYNANESMADTLKALENIRAGEAVLLPGGTVLPVPPPAGDSFFDLWRRLEETDGRGFRGAGDRAEKVLKALVRLAVVSCGYSTAALVRDFLSGPEREKHDLARMTTWGLLLVLLCEAARRAGFSAGEVIQTAHELVTERAQERGEGTSLALNQPHKVIPAPIAGGYRCIPCKADIWPTTFKVAGAWEAAREEFFKTHGRPRI